MESSVGFSSKILARYDEEFMNNSGYSILLIEDNPDHLSFERKIVEKLDGISQVSTARNAREARAEMGRKEYDLIILDYDLPDSDGIVFLESLTNSRSDVPVVMVTGLGNEKVAVRAMKLGAYDYIVKDKDYLKTLPEVINRSLEKLRLSRSLKKIEIQLKKSEERYQDLYENANSGFISINLNTKKFINPNKKMLEITGYTRQELEKMNHYELQLKEEKDKIIKIHEKDGQGNLQIGESHIELEFWIKIKKGKKFVNCTGTVFPKINEMFLTFNDITDKKILEEKLRKAHEQLKKHTRELENEVDELKKQLVIEPTLETPGEEEQKYNLDFGCSYLLKESRPHKSYEIFKDLVSHEVFGLVVTRTYPKRVQQMRHLDKTPMVWLSRNESEETAISGSNLSALYHTISEFVGKGNKSVIILDGLEHLVTVNNFDRTIQFMNDLFEIIMTNQAILLIPVDPQALEKKEIAILERSTEEISCMINGNGTLARP
jgi:PAS domain S-box-containing protein